MRVNSIVSDFVRYQTRILAGFVFCALAMGANAAPIVPSKAVSDKVERLSIEAFCPALGKAIRDAKGKTRTEYTVAMLNRGMRTEGLRRNDIDAIEERHPEIGMVPCSVIAAMGRPVRKHEHHGAGAPTMQIVFERGGHSVYVYVAFVDGDFRVTNWSN